MDAVTDKSAVKIDFAEAAKGYREHMRRTIERLCREGLIRLPAQKPEKETGRRVLL